MPSADLAQILRPPQERVPLGTWGLDFLRR